MATMGNYCKAYPLGRLREFGGWSENPAGVRRERREVEGSEVEAPRELTDDDFLYLQENFTVTDGIFLDEHVVFDDVTAEWLDFCERALKFEVPVFEGAGKPDAP